MHLNRSWKVAAPLVLVAASGLVPSTCAAGPLSDMLLGGRNDAYYQGGHARPHAAPANPVTASYGPAPANSTTAYSPPAYSAPAYSAPAYSTPTYSAAPAAPAATNGALTPTTSYYASPSSSGTVTNGYGQPTTVLSPPVSVAPATANSPVVTYRLSAPVVTQQAAVAPLGGTTGSSIIPATAYSPTTTYSPTTAYYANTAATANASACNTCSVPATSYRTVWYRVPVTNFRQVTAIDPATGCPTTVMRPCTTYQWQARRVPDERPRNWFSRLFCCFHRRPDPPPVTVPPVAVTTNCVPAYGCPPTAAPATSMPYYTSPSTTTVPSTVAPSTTAPTTVPSYTTPGTTPGTYSPSTPGAVPLREPADYPPRLDPTTAPPASNLQREGSAYPPPASNGDSINGSYNGPSNGSSNGNSNGSNGNSYGSDRSNGDQDTEQNNSNTSIRGPATLGPATGASTDLRRTPQPVPDPDALMNGPKRFEPPRLLNPRDRSASYPVQRAGAFVLVSWPETRADDEPQKLEPKPAEITPPSRSTQQRGYDDSGWRSIAR